MRGSLRRHLSLTLGGAVLLTALLAAAASFGLAYQEAKEFQDDMLRQIAAIAAGLDGAAGVRPDAGGDSESRLQVLRMGRDAAPAWLPAALAPGFHTLDAEQGSLRVFASAGPAAGQVVVAQPTEVRDEIAANSALRSFVPLLLLLPLLAGLVVRIVGRELGPVARLAHHLDEQDAERIRPLSDVGLPSEVAPFVHAINRLLHRVNDLIGQQRRFVADASHELRSPLTAISLQAQNLASAPTLEVVRARLPALREGIERARRLSAQLLDLARTEALDVDGQATDAVALARDLLEEFMPMAEAKGIDLGLEDCFPATFAAAPDVLRQILRNAVENALLYTPPGGTVSLRVYCADGEQRFEVVDDGPGIPADQRERVFDAFYRIPGAAGEGSGIGLAIARQAARRLGGVVSLHDRRGGHGLKLRYRQQATHPD